MATFHTAIDAGKKHGHEVLNFDDIAVDQSAPIPTPYHEFTFSNIFAMNPSGLFGDNRHSGFVRGVTSGEHVAYFRDVGAVDIINSVGTFTFESARLTAGADSALTINIFGLHNNAVLYAQTITLNDRHPLLFEPDWQGIDRILIQTGAETPDPKSPSSGPFVVMDDLKVFQINPTDEVAPAGHPFAHAGTSVFGQDVRHALFETAAHHPGHVEMPLA